MKTLRPLLILALAIVLNSCAEQDDITELNDINTIKVNYSQMDLEVVDLVNTHRASLNLPTLKLLNLASYVADSHTDYMFQIGQVSHANFNERCIELIENANAKNVAENLAFGYTSSKAVMDSWLASDEHRKKIESASFSDIGISSKMNNEGKYYYTQIFIGR